MDGVMTVTNR